jgi:hypothetical protein
MSSGQPKLVPAIGAIDGVNKDFATPTQFIPGTTRVFHNGVLLDPSGDDTDFDGDGWTEQSDNLTIRMNFPPRTDDTMFIYYEDTSMGGGMPGGVPIIISAQELAPALKTVIELRPDLFSAGEVADLIPEIVRVTGLRPSMKQAVNLRPRIIDTEVN